MPRFEIKVPKLGESITEGTIVSWFVKMGDVTQEGDVLFKVNTVKVSAEISSSVAGKVMEILFREEDTVTVDTAIVVVGMGGEEASDEETASGRETPESEENASSDAEKIPSQIVRVEERWYSPVVIQLVQGADTSKEELDPIQGTGYEGRLNKKGIKGYIEKRERRISEVSKAAIPTGDAPTASMPSSIGGAGFMTTSPVAASVQAPVTAPSALSEQAPAAANISGVEVKEIDRVCRIIADRMVMSKKVSPRVTDIMEVNMTKLIYWCEKNKDALFRRGGMEPTYMPIITETVTKALVTYPQVNVPVDGHNILFKKRINIGIAVSLNDGNLIVPVVYDADHLNLNGLAVAIDSLVLRARGNRLMPGNIDGGTSTVINFGISKDLFDTPMINQPQVVILGVGYIGKKPAVIETPEGDMIAIRHKIHLFLSYDHRVVDGMLGGNPLHFITDCLEDWKG